MSMAVVFAKLIATIALAVSNSGALSTAVHTSRASAPAPIATLTVICNPAWGTIVLPICI
jgi:hypothetical protein